VLQVSGAEQNRRTADFVGEGTLIGVIYLKGSPMQGTKEDIPGVTDGKGHCGLAQHEMRSYSFEGKGGHSV